MRLISCFLGIALVACGSSGGGPGKGAGSGGGSGSGGPGTGPGAAAYPAFAPSMPQLLKGGSLPVIASPIVVPVYFAEDTMQAAMDGNMSS